MECLIYALPGHEDQLPLRDISEVCAVAFGYDISTCSVTQDIPEGGRISVSPAPLHPCGDRIVRDTDKLDTLLRIAIEDARRCVRDIQSTPQYKWLEQLPSSPHSRFSETKQVKFMHINNWGQRYWVAEATGDSAIEFLPHIARLPDAFLVPETHALTELAQYAKDGAMRGHRPIDAFHQLIDAYKIMHPLLTKTDGQPPAQLRIA